MHKRLRDKLPRAGRVVELVSECLEVDPATVGLFMRSGVTLGLRASGGIAQKVEGRAIEKCRILGTITIGEIKVSHESLVAHGRVLGVQHRQVVRAVRQAGKVAPAFDRTGGTATGMKRAWSRMLFLHATLSSDRRTRSNGGRTTPRSHGGRVTVFKTLCRLHSHLRGDIFTKHDYVHVIMAAPELVTIVHFLADISLLILFIFECFSRNTTTAPRPRLRVLLRAFPAKLCQETHTSELFCKGMDRSQRSLSNTCKPVVEKENLGIVAGLGKTGRRS
ncbi:hypothetical protein HG530_002509 [Fusarium avenaceum]|nr:hypothetical protein HG530_002509 [Fusarium avenaceum]